MNNNTSQQSYTLQGNKSSFWKLTSENAILIPIIQRDYAQGRSNDNVRQIREPFLNKIFSVLASEEGHLELDFIYGSLEKPKNLSKSNQEFLDFTPLDGQQRLTTLFLLHWFLAIWDNDNYDEFKNHMTGRFSYRTRTSSTNFCENLIERTCPSEVISSLCNTEHSISISKQVMDEGWFHNQWKNDPTIIGMLNMLDTIYVIFSSYTTPPTDTAKQYFDKLTCQNVDDCPITFNLLYLNQGDFHLSDELYIKMNSRGKPLSDFETFKARFETFLKSTTVPNDFSKKIDGDWADVFWGLRNDIKPKSKESSNDYYRDNTDGMMMNLIKFILANEYAILANDKDNGLDELFESQAAKKHNPNIRLTFYRYTELGVINEVDDRDSLDEKTAKQINDNNNTIANAIYNNFQLVCGLINDKNFELNKNIVDLDIKGYLQNVLFNEIDGKDSKFTNISYGVRLILWSYLSYSIKHKADIQAGNTRGLNRWMRFIRNMVESVEINTANDMQKAIKYLNAINLPSDIVNYLAALDEAKTPDCSPFPKTQIKEEIIKAKLIQKHPLWEKAINEADNVKVWPGRSGYLLYFIDVVSTNGISSIDNHHPATIVKFQRYKKMIDSLMPYMNKDNEYILQRALLAKGYYMRPESDGNSIYSLMDQSVSGRSYSWRQMIQYNGIDCENDTSIYKEGVYYLQQVLDDPDFNTSDIQNSLLSIVGNGKLSITDWRWPLLDMPALWDESHQRFIWIDKDTKRAWFPRKKGGRTNHYETWAYHLFLSLEENSKNNMYCYSHNSYNIYVTLSFLYKENRYQLMISHDNQKSQWLFEMSAIDEEGKIIDDMSVEMRAFIFGIMPNNNKKFYKASEKDAIIWAQAIQDYIARSYKIEDI